MLSQVLKEAIRESGWSANALANEIGVQPSTLTRFINGESSPCALADKLSEALGLELIEEVVWSDYIENFEPDPEAWAEHEAKAWTGTDSVEHARWYGAEFPKWVEAEREKWEKAERKRLEGMSWIRIVD